MFTNNLCLEIYAQNSHEYDSWNNEIFQHSNYFISSAYVARYAKHFEISRKLSPNSILETSKRDEIVHLYFLLNLLNQLLTINSRRLSVVLKQITLAVSVPSGENDPILINRRTRWRENATPARERARQFPLSLPL